MVVVYIEPRPKGDAPIQNYVVEDHANHPLGTFKTQEEATEWATAAGHSVHVARVRNTDRGNPDHWRSIDARPFANRLFPTMKN
jgi:hypothetical protein